MSRNKKTDSLVDTGADQRLPFDPEAWMDAFSRAAHALESLPSSVRPRAMDDSPGGLVLLDPALPCLILPDLHARPLVLEALERARPPLPAQDGSPTVCEALDEGLLQVVMLGDGPHSEGPEASVRWKEAFLEYQSGWTTDSFMRQEMALAFTAMAHAARLMAAYPGRFFFLKGNHDNIRNREGLGDHPYGKYASEGEMAADWTRRSLGTAFFDSYAALEDAFPLMARGGGFLACHAEPIMAFSPAELIDGRLDPAVVEGLTWTDLGAADPDAVEGTLRAFFPGPVKPGVMIGGHRPGVERFYLRADGRFIQIHNAARMQAALVVPGKPFDPWGDIIDLEASSPQEAGSSGPSR